MQNFEILIVSAIIICKQCLQTASAGDEVTPYLLPTGVSTLDPTGGLASPDPLGYRHPEMKIPA